MRKSLESICEALISSEGLLNELDRQSGDGDCGTTHKAGATGMCGVDKDQFSNIEST